MKYGDDYKLLQLAKDIQSDLDAMDRTDMERIFAKVLYMDELAQFFNELP
ncbi:hypothetical protein H310_08084 [Aphanomyces invadans]|uniref:Uncharacterized protein n=1 Tax=Aphanomyces invadans TaxID=157072 RepID=A0A024U0G7_9STRA|nr:hypothetical protein H310_08084 [Aphanomyces invadans]ETV99371.1 hypothetical protein H310_08084 [Aphanomyces invadans]|eukprot:XP_008871927.1 hypothetical protein H310_08084 [Aphanomyces invadans]